MEQLLKNCKRIVIKVGSSLFYSQKEKIDFAFLDALVSQVSTLLKSGKEVVIVSSGAITLGSHILELKEKPKDLSGLQAVAAVGQNVLMDVYSSRFLAYDIKCAQILLTWDDLSERKRYLNAKNTLSTLIKLGALPIINENDTVSTEEIKFGDNDKLSALVAALVNADLLIILSDVDGLLDAEKKVVRVVDKINAEIKSLACPTTKKTCVGGMITKIEAASISTDSGIACVIANGHTKDAILSIAENAFGSGTIFLPKEARGAKERWLAFGTKPKGKVVVDDGAKKALVNHKSLLSVGVVGYKGDFEIDDIVSLVDKEDNEFARGKISLSAKALEKVKGERSSKEVIHCDNIALLV